MTWKIVAGFAAGLIIAAAFGLLVLYGLANAFVSAGFDTIGSVFGNIHK